jgi:subtilisin family serine protease
MDGHGTMVAGIVAAHGTGGIGLSGVNPRARIMPLRALGDDGQVVRRTW